MILEVFSHLGVVPAPLLVALDLLVVRLWAALPVVLLDLLAVRLQWVVSQQVDRLGKISQNIATCMQEFLEQHILKVQKHLYLKK
jgi:hypothetical protein